jgi:fatty acid desaturase
MGFKLNWDQPTDGFIQIINDSTIGGYRYSTGWAKNQRVYFTSIFSSKIKSYRFIHNKHHQGLGTDLDPENSYSEEFDLTWLFTALLGIRVIKTLFKRQKIEQSGKQLLMLNASACFHLVVLILLNEFLGITSSIAWGLGYFIVMPFFGSIRNVLEHKYEMDQIDLKKIESIEGITLPIYTTRLFTEKLMSKIFGVVGFDRHLIHHWDPSISALNLGKVNEFLLTTELGPMLRDLPTTYTKAFLRLMKNG